MKTVNDFNFKGRKAIVRVDFNVPYDENFHITEQPPPPSRRSSRTEAASF